MNPIEIFKINNLVKKTAILMALTFVFCTDLTGQSLIEGMVVETYYVSNENDEIDPNYKTYRIYLDICECCKLREVFGSTNNPLRIESTDNFYNSQFGGTFAFNINTAFILAFNDAPLDSYIGFGASSSGHWGIRKDLDTDGSIWEGRVPPEALTNDTEEIGIPLTENDGLLNSNGESTTPPSWQTSVDLTPLSNVFGTSTASNSFYSENFFLRSSAGVSGQSSANAVLIAQLTTAGELEYNLNVVIEDCDGNTITYVSTQANSGQQFSNHLFYPPECGCTDPNFIEFDPAAGCDDGSCLTPIVFGCLNPEACNYNPDANWDVPELCCFVDSCQGLDISILCPTLSVEDSQLEETLLYPNPTNGVFTIGSTQGKFLQKIDIYNIQGRLMNSKFLNKTENAEIQVEVPGLNPGLYLVVLTYFDGSSTTQKIQRIN